MDLVFEVQAIFGATMTTLPAHLREALEKAAREYSNPAGLVLPTSPEKTHMENAATQFRFGAEWLYSHLCETAGRGFDNEAAMHEGCRVSVEIYPTEHSPTIIKSVIFGARWQHTQSLALIESLKSEIAQLKAENADLRSEVVTLELTGIEFRGLSK
jgi:hypothetical protein